MAIRFYTNSTKAWGAMLSALSHAKISIYIEMYIFSDDTGATHDFIGTLIERASQGVQVILILDAFGSSGLSSATLSRLRESGIEVRFFRHWIHRTHQKTIIVDGTLALTGGVNITEHARNWNDLQIAVTGSIARRLVSVFARTYILSGGTQKLVSHTKRAFRKHRVRMWILEHTPLATQLTLKTYYTQKLTEAKSRIVFVTPYFIPHNWLLTAMRSAVARGVHVELLIPEKTDSAILDAINRSYVSRAHSYGVKCYITPGTNHAKAALIDTSEGLIGSANIDSLSFDHNNELGIFFTDQAAVHALQKIIDTWKLSATIYTPTLHTVPWYYMPLVFIARIFHPFF